MIIILEGPDGSGKTTLAKKLQAQTGFELIHKSWPKTQDEMDKMADEYLELVKTKKDLIIDRSWYSEIIYGVIMRNHVSITPEQVEEIEHEIAKQGGLVIYCTGPLDKLWYNCLARGEEYVHNYWTYSKIYSRYYTLFENWQNIIPIVKYEITQPENRKDEYEKLFVVR